MANVANTNWSAGWQFTEQSVGIERYVNVNPVVIPSTSTTGLPEGNFGFVNFSGLKSVEADYLTVRRNLVISNSGSPARKLSLTYKSTVGSSFLELNASPAIVAPATTLPSKYALTLQLDGKTLDWEPLTTTSATSANRCALTADINYSDTAKSFLIHDPAVNGSGWYIESVKIEVPTAFTTQTAKIQIGNASNPTLYLATSNNNLSLNGARVFNINYAAIAASDSVFVKFVPGTGDGAGKCRVLVYLVKPEAVAAS